MKVFYAWADRYGFAGMNKEARWSVVDLIENLTAVGQWLATLPERQRKSLIHPLSVMRRWRRSLTPPKVETDAVTKAEAAWTRFVALMETLPPDQAMPLWQTVQSEATAHLATQ
jgi:hypothetical protein